MVMCTGGSEYSMKQISDHSSFCLSTLIPQYKCQKPQQLLSVFCKFAVTGHNSELLLDSTTTLEAISTTKKKVSELEKTTANSRRGDLSIKYSVALLEKTF